MVVSVELVLRLVSAGVSGVASVETVGTVWGGGAMSGPGHDKSRIFPMRFSPLSPTFTIFLCYYCYYYYYFIYFSPGLQSLVRPGGPKHLGT